MQTGEHSSGLGQWRTVHRPADPRLRAWVHGYFASSSELRVPVLERHVPSLEIPLLLNFGTPHRRRDESGQWTAHDGAWIVGLHERQHFTEAVGERHFMVVRFTPIGAHLFLGLPMHLLANQALELALIDPLLARTVLGRVGSSRSWSGRFAVMETLIAERIAATSFRAGVDPVWRSLVARDGRVALGPIAADLGCSHRNLIAQFRSCVGLPPKRIARLLRFNHVMRTLDRLSGLRREGPAGAPYAGAAQAGGRFPHAVHWAGLAADSGYFDQAHFIRDFRAFAGSTPAAFLRQVSYLG